MNGSASAKSYVFVNVTADEPLSTALLEWMGVNETMNQGSWYVNKTGLSDGAYKFRVWGNDSSGNWNSTEFRVVYVDSRPPTLGVSSPINATTINIFNDWLYGNVSDQTTKVDSLNISLNGAPYGVLPVNQTTGRFSAKMNYTQGAENNIAVVAFDSAGNRVSKFIQVTVRSNLANATKNATAGEAVVVNETLNNTDSAFEIVTNTNLTFQINVTAFGNESYLGINSLTNSSAFGLFDENETALGKFIEIVTTDNINSTSGNLSSAKIKLYVRSEDLDLDGDGIYNGTGDINLTSVKIYWYNASGGSWHPLIKGADYEVEGPFVFDHGVDETPSLFYLGFAFANISHFSVYGVSASVYGGGSVVSGGGASTPSGRGGGGGGGTSIPRVIGLTTSIIKVISTDSNFAGLIRQFNYFQEEFFDAPSTLWGALEALGLHWAPLEWAVKLNPITHPHDVEPLIGNVYAISSEKATDKYSTGADRVILARGDLGLDSIAATAYAKVLNVPILLSEPDNLPADTLEALNQLGQPEVIIVGGPEAIFPEVESQLSASSRIGGVDRYETAKLLAEAVMSETEVKELVITDGLAPDGVALTVASYYNTPIVFVKGDLIPEPTEEFLFKNRFETIILIGVSEAAEEKVKNLK